MGEWTDAVEAAPSSAMLASSHTLAGGSIGALLPGHPILAFALGVGSHLVMDAIPHWGCEDHAEFMRVARRDGAGVAASLLALGAGADGMRPAVLAGATGGLLLDLNKPCLEVFGRSPFPAFVERVHANIQQGREAPHRMRQELIVAAGLAATAALLIRRARRHRSRR